MKQSVLCAGVLATLMTIVCGHDLAAQKPIFSCPAEASGWVRVDQDQWWDMTVEEFETEGITVYDEFGEFTAEFDAAAAALGFADGAALETFVREDQWDFMDENRNGLVCIRILPVTPGMPAFFFGGIDDRASTPRGVSAESGLP
jgi:hypothetical protein